MEQRQLEPIVSPQIIAIEPAVKPSRRGRTSKKLEESGTTAAVTPLLPAAEPTTPKRQTSASRNKRSVAPEKVWAVPDPTLSPPAPATQDLAAETSLERLQQLREQVTALQTQAAAIAQQSQALSTEMQALQQTARSLPRTVDLPPLPARAQRPSQPSTRLSDWADLAGLPTPPAGSTSAAQPAAKPTSSQTAVAPSVVHTVVPTGAVPVIEPIASPIHESVNESVTRPVSLSQQQQAIVIAQALRHPVTPAQPRTQHSSYSAPATFTRTTTTSRTPEKASNRTKNRTQNRTQSRMQNHPAHRHRAQSNRASLRSFWIQFRPFLDIPKQPGTIAIDAGLWTLVAMGLRVGLQIAIAGLPWLALPLNLLMLLPAATAAYLAFCVPQSSTAIVYRLLLITLGLFLGGRL